LRRAARDAAPPRVGRRLAERHTGDDAEVVRDPEEIADSGVQFDRHAIDACAEPLVDGGQQHEHEGRTRVHEPERHRPLDLVAVLQLVGLAIPVVVVMLAGKHEHMRGGRPEPRLHVRGPFAGFLCGEGLQRAGIGDDEQALALAEACAGRAPHGGDDAFEHLRRHCLGQVVPNHPASPEEVAELHGASLRERRTRHRAESPP
jgi:hypothetical protein